MDPPPASKKPDNLRGCDLLQEVSITIRRFKKTSIPKERYPLNPLPLKCIHHSLHVDTSNKGYFQGVKLASVALFLPWTEQSSLWFQFLTDRCTDWAVCFYSASWRGFKTVVCCLNPTESSAVQCCSSQNSMRSCWTACVSARMRRPALSMPRVSSWTSSAGWLGFTQTDLAGRDVWY